MSFDSNLEVADALDKTSAELGRLTSDSERDIQSLMQSFQQLASQTHTILPLASAMVAAIENDSVSSVLSKVQTLGEAAKEFVRDRLRATTGILNTVTAEVKLLRKLSSVTKSQASIALKTSVLTMLINIEVGRLGSSGSGFRDLAEELGRFSISLTEDTDHLAVETTARRLAIESSFEVLSAQLPQLHLEFIRIDGVLGKEMSALQAGLAELSAMPTHFRACMEDLLRQIDSVVAAVQTHDITRQQIEHVREACTLISGELRAGKFIRRHAPNRLTRAYICICIQIYQLKNIQATAAGWTSQIRTCVEVIVNVGASDLAQISPLVVEQQREVSSKLAHIELLEQQGEGYSSKIRRTIGKDSNLVELIAEQGDKAKIIRQCLHLLALNSIVQANQMGAAADTIIELSKGISDLSEEWSLITDQSGQTMNEIQLIVQQTSDMMLIFSETGDERLREAQIQTTAGLVDLQNASAAAAQQSQLIESVTQAMQSTRSEVTRSGDLLDLSYAQLDTLLHLLEDLKVELERKHPDIRDGFSQEEMKDLFSSSYTTEIEREVLRAALEGEPLPVTQSCFSGNSVELF